MAEPARHPRLLPIGEIAILLAEQIGTLAPELLRGGRRSGAEWVCGSLAGEPGTQLAVHLSGAKKGVWKDFRADVAGDALDLVAQARFGGDKRLALQWARRWLRLDDADPAALAAIQRQAAQREVDGEAAATASRAAAFRLWLSAAPRIAGTPVEVYLAGRGIDLAQLGRQPGALRFHSRLWCDEVKAYLPGMVTAISDPDGKFIACHRTFLEQAAPGDWRKARLECAKKVLGAFKGGAIRLWRGASGKPLREAPAGEIVEITEGIEDGLSVAMADPALRVVAAVSLSNIGNLVLPAQITTLRIWRQNDTAPAAIGAFDRAVHAQLARGLTVLIPDLPLGVKDVNDLLQTSRL